MYKSLLCWRYLKTRYLAMACIVSVMLGVATLIVVNSVMSGFSTKLRERLHGILSDVVIDSNSLEGFADPDGKMQAIRNDPVLGPRVAAMTPTLEVFAMLQFRYPNGEMHTRPVRLIGFTARELEGGPEAALLFADDEKARKRRLDGALDEIASRFGKGSLRRGPAADAGPAARS